jgi:hypothetical protein
MIRRLSDLKSFKQLAKSAGRDRADTLLRGMSDDGYSAPHRSWSAGRCWDTKEKARVELQWVLITHARLVKMPRKGPRSITQYHRGQPEQPKQCDERCEETRSRSVRLFCRVPRLQGQHAPAMIHRRQEQCQNPDDDHREAKSVWSDDAFTFGAPNLAIRKNCWIANPKVMSAVAVLTHASSVRS